MAKKAVKCGLVAPGDRRCRSGRDGKIGVGKRPSAPQRTASATRKRAAPSRNPKRAQRRGGPSLRDTPPLQPFDRRRRAQTGSPGVPVPGRRPRGSPRGPRPPFGRPRASFQLFQHGPSPPPPTSVTPRARLGRPPTFLDGPRFRPTIATSQGAAPRASPPASATNREHEPISKGLA